MEKWDVVRVFCDFIPSPHDKFCICICPLRRWFMFINSEPPAFRKARALAVEVSAFEATFLNHTSYIDTTKLMELPDDALALAIADAERHHGKTIKTVRDRIIVAVEAHEVMPEDQRQAVIG